MTTATNRGDKPPALLVTLRPPGFGQFSEELKEINRNLRARLTDFSYSEELDKAPEMSMTLENTDLYWIDEQGGADGVAEGAIVEFQFGYVDPVDPEEDFLSLPRFHKISSKPSISKDKITIKATSVLQTLLGSVIAPQWFKPQKVSELVRGILAEAGFDADHRVIQDTGFVDNYIAATTRETYLEFIYRLARGYNYRFYITPAPDGKPIAHFHKPGWTSRRRLVRERSDEIAGLFGGISDLFAPSEPAQSNVNSLGEGLAAQRDVTDAQAEILEAAFGKGGNGNFAPNKGTIRYRPNPTADSRVLDFNIAFEADGTPAAMQAAGTDADEGKFFDESVRLVRTEDKDEDSLSGRSPHAKAEGKRALPPNPTQVEKFEFENPDLTELLPKGPRRGELFPNETGNDEDAERTILRDKPAESELSVGLTDKPGGLFGISNTGFAVYTDTDNKKVKEHTKAHLEKAQSEIVALDLKLRGIPNMDAGDIWKVEGFRMFSQRYLVKSVIHAYSPGGGYTTAAKMTSDGVNSQKFDETGRKTPDDVTLEVGIADRGATGGSVFQLVRADGTVAVDPEGSTDKKLPGE